MVLLGCEPWRSDSDFWIISACGSEGPVVIRLLGTQTRLHRGCGRAFNFFIEVMEAVGRTAWVRFESSCGREDLETVVVLPWFDMESGCGETMVVLLWFSVNRAAAASMISLCGIHFVSYCLHGAAAKKFGKKFGEIGSTRHRRSATW